MTKVLWEGNSRPLFETVSGSKGHIPVVESQFGHHAGNLDALGRLRVSNPVALFDSKVTHQDNTLLWFSKITNNSGNAGSTWKPNEAAVVLSVDASDTVIRQSKEYIPYQPGKSQQITMTFIADTPQANVSQKMGYFDGENGVFFEASGLNLRVVRRSFVSGAAVEEVAEQADWNIDTLDGSGFSEELLDVSKSQLLMIDFSWLGVGAVRFGFLLDGEPLYFHEFQNSNILGSVFMSTPDLPVRYEISGTSDLTSIVSLSAICAVVSSEGGLENQKALPFSAGNGGSLVTVSSDIIPIVSIRPRATFFGQTNRVLFDLQETTIFSEDGPLAYEIVYGASLDGASWVDANSDFSAMQLDIAATGASGGIVVAQGYIAAAKISGGTRFSDLKSRLPMALEIDGSHPASPLSDSYTITGIRIGATNTDVGAHFSWKERR